MSFEDFSSEEGLFGEESEEDDYSVDFLPETSVEEAEEERWERYGSIYRKIVRPALDNFECSFTTDEVLEEIRPPYSREEVDGALSYGVEEGEVDRNEGSSKFEI